MKRAEDYFAFRSWEVAPASLPDLLERRAAAEPTAEQFGFLDEGGVQERLSVGELAELVQRVASALLAAGLRAGEEVLLLLPPDRTFVLGMLGAMRAGLAPAAVYPPSSPQRLAQQIERVRNVLADCGARYVLCAGPLVGVARMLAARAAGALQVLRLEDALVQEPLPLPPPPGPEDLAFLQYTSGSTGDPKGVPIRHGNLMAQLWALGAALPPMLEVAGRARQRVVSWLPPYHDMGLVGCVFYPIYWGIRSYLASPLLFIQKPWLWLRWISDLRATQTVAPNFAYQRCAGRLPERHLQGIDLSSLEVAWNGAEPIQAEVVRGFSERFAAQGFRAEAFFPVYGMAEATLCATHCGYFEPLQTERLSRSVWEREGRAQSATPGEDALELVCVGRPAAGIELQIVDPAGAALPERQRGEIVLRGSSVMAGYHRRAPGPEWTPEGFLATGDLGYLAGGRLFVGGRRKDLIIVSGRNVFPHDIEHAAGSVPGVRTGRAVAFGVDDGKGSETVVLCVEVRPATERADERSLKRALRAAVEDFTGILPSKVEIVPDGWVPKTSSGKLQRGAAKARYLAEPK